MEEEEEEEEDFYFGVESVICGFSVETKLFCFLFFLLFVLVFILYVLFALFFFRVCNIYIFLCWTDE